MAFDDPNLVSHAGLVPVMALAERAGLPDLIAEHVRPGGDCGVNAHLKVPCLVAGMAGGADSIDDMDALRHGAMGTLFAGIRAPSTLGSHLRSYNWGNVHSWRRRAGGSSRGWRGRRRCCPARRSSHSSTSTRCRSGSTGTASRARSSATPRSQGSRSRSAGLNALAATICTPLSAPVIAATRLRGGNAASVRGAASLAARAIATARECGCTGLVIVRVDSAYYAAEVIAAIRRAGARFSVTVPKNCKVKAAIAAIGEDDWTAIRYPRAIWDDQLGCWVSEAEVAETSYTAFEHDKEQGGRRPADRPPGPRPEREGRRGTGRAVPRLAPPRGLHRLPRRDRPGRGPAQGPRDRGAGLRRRHQRPARPPAVRPVRGERGVAVDRGHRPQPAARGRRPGQPALAKARGATIRRDLVAVAARTARHGRGHVALHLPEGWHREREWLSLWEAACGPPAAAA